MKHIFYFSLIYFFSTCVLNAATTETLYLSGTGSNDQVDWEFFCTDGRNSKVWTTIPVPSCWELEGFGTYNYGHDKNPGTEQGLYKYAFQGAEPLLTKQPNVLPIMVDDLNDWVGVHGGHPQAQTP